MKKYKKSIIILLITALLSGCGNNMYESQGKQGYTSVQAVDGISFDISSSVVRNATAITNISEDMDFEVNQTYLYKDGGNSYFLFNMGVLVCAVEKGTNFHFDNSDDKAAALKESDILGIWFNSPKRKGVDYDESNSNGIYKFIGTVTAEVSLTSEIYNDFSGKLAVLSTGEEEWSMFVGSLGKDYDSLAKTDKEAIEYMTSTFTINTTNTAAAQEEPVISLGGYDNTSEGSSEEIISETNSSEPEIQSETESVSTNEQPVDESNDEQTTQEDMEIRVIEDEEPFSDITTEATIIEEPESTLTESTEEIPEIEITTESESESQNEQETQQTQEAANTADNEDSSNELVTLHKTITLDNQKKQNFNDDTVYTSDIYSVLPLGKKGYASVYTGKEYEKAIVKPDKLYTGKEAATLVKDMYKEKYFETGSTNSWNVLHYTVDYSECSKPAYIDTKILGMDGENLRFRGIEYDSRTYDIPISDTEGYIFYAVPNGCREYLISFGDSPNANAEENGLVKAYYKISLEK